MKNNEVSKKLEKLREKFNEFNFKNGIVEKLFPSDYSAMSTGVTHETFMLLVDKKYESIQNKNLKSLNFEEKEDLLNSLKFMSSESLKDFIDSL